MSVTIVTVTLILSSLLYLDFNPSEDSSWLNMLLLALSNKIENSYKERPHVWSTFFFGSVGWFSQMLFGEEATSLLLFPLRPWSSFHFPLCYFEIVGKHVELMHVHYQYRDAFILLLAFIPKAWPFHMISAQWLLVMMMLNYRFLMQNM